MRTGQREGRVVVIERRRRPAAGGVADRAVRRESRGDVIGIRGAVVVGLVTAVARRGRGVVVVIRVALRAGQRGVHTCKRIVGVHRMVKGHAGPVGSRMAGLTCGGETSRCVIRVGCPIPIGLMASVAGCGQRCVVVVHMALRTGNGRMRSC